MDLFDVDVEFRDVKVHCQLDGAAGECDVGDYEECDGRLEKEPEVDV